MKQELDPADIVEEEEEEEEDDDDEEDDEEEEEEECRKFSPKQCQKLQFSIAQIMGFDSSETTQNAEEDNEHRDQSDQGQHGDQSDQRGRWSEGVAKEVKVGRFIHSSILQHQQNCHFCVLSLFLALFAFSFDTLLFLPKVYKRKIKHFF